MNASGRSPHRRARQPRSTRPSGCSTTARSTRPSTTRSRPRRSRSARRTKEAEMAIGPVQLIVLGFEHPQFHGEIIAELERLRESDTVRVIDALAVHKDAAGDIEVMHLSNLSKDEAVELGSKVGALVGLGIEGEEGMVAGAEAGRGAAAGGGGVVFGGGAGEGIRGVP